MRPKATCVCGLKLLVYEPTSLTAFLPPLAALLAPPSPSSAQGRNVLQINLVVHFSEEDTHWLVHTQIQTQTQTQAQTQTQTHALQHVFFVLKVLPNTNASLNLDFVNG